MGALSRINPYVWVFLTVCIALIWRPFLIGFYGDDFSHAAADTLEQALFYGRRERFFYFMPIAIPRYFIGHDPVGWGVYAIVVAGLTAVALYGFLHAVLSRIPVLEERAQPAAMAGAVLYILMPWSLAPVLWNTSLSQLVMAALLMLAGWVLFAPWALAMRTILFAVLFAVANLTYETSWGGWIPLILIKLAVDEPEQRRETLIIAALSMVVQIALVVNYLPSVGISARVMAGGDLAASYKVTLFFENVFVRFPYEILSSMGFIGLIGAPFAVYVVYWLCRRRGQYGNTKLWLVGLACAAGILGGVLVVSLGNYRVTAATDDARFLTVISIWLSLLVAMALAVAWTRGTRGLRIACYAVYAAIVLGFFLRAGGWVQGYFFQQDMIERVPAERIVALVEAAEQREGVARPVVENETMPLLLVEFDAPMYVFHGMDNPRGARFLTREIKRRTGKTLFTVPAQGRVKKTIFEGTRVYQPLCVQPDELKGDYTAPIVIFWHVGTGEVKEVRPPFIFGCSRTIHRFEYLGELLYPFMGNPRRF